MIRCAAKSGKFLSYRCSNALRHDPQFCCSGWLSKSKVKSFVFVIDRLRGKVLTEENLIMLVRMVSEEIRLLAEQTKLERAKDEAMTELEETEPKGLQTEQALDYAKDLKAPLSQGTFIEQKTFLRSFIKRIDFEPGLVAIDYTIPIPLGKDKYFDREVLYIDHNSRLYRIKGRTVKKTFKLSF